MKLIVLLVLMLSQTMIFSNDLSLIKLKNIENEIMTTLDNGLTWTKVKVTSPLQPGIANLKDIHWLNYSSIDNGLNWVLNYPKKVLELYKADDFDIKVFSNPADNILHLSNIPNVDKCKLRISDINLKIVFGERF